MCHGILGSTGALLCDRSMRWNWLTDANLETKEIGSEYRNVSALYTMLLFGDIWIWACRFGTRTTGYIQGVICALISEIRMEEEGMQNAWCG